MSSFTSKLCVTPLENGKDWKLTRQFTYHIGSKYSNRCINVPRGFVTDFASVPKIFQLILPEYAKTSKAPVLHDYLYNVQEIMGEKITRKEADDTFLEAMFVDWRMYRSRYFVANLEYLAVRLFAWLAWRHKLATATIPAYLVYPPESKQTTQKQEC